MREIIFFANNKTMTKSEPSKATQQLPGLITKPEVIDSLTKLYPSINPSIIRNYIDRHIDKHIKTIRTSQQGWADYYIHENAAFRRNFEQYIEATRRSNEFRKKNPGNDLSWGGKPRRQSKPKKVAATGKVHTGPRGGKYVIRKGQKVYL